MNSRTTRAFREAFRHLPEQVQQQARRSYDSFRVNQNHPSLRFKLVDAQSSIYSARIARRYRALAVLEGDEWIWFWVGTHGDYDKILKSRSS